MHAVARSLGTKKVWIVLTLLVTLSTLLLIPRILSSATTEHVDRFWHKWTGAENLRHGAIADPAVRNRTLHFERICKQPDPFEALYGRTNIRMSRGYEGSHFLLRRFYHKVLRGEAVTIGVLGGSVTNGHGISRHETWFHHLILSLQDWFPNDVTIEEINGAAPAIGSDYWSFCFPLHIPETVDLVFVEAGVNDDGDAEHVDNMENLLRGLLQLPKRPAIVLVEALAFSGGGMGGGGGRMHLPVAQYFDVPVVNQRHTMATHLSRFPELVEEVFVGGFGGYDTRHINSASHGHLGNLVASFFKDVACEMFNEPGFHVPPQDIGISDLVFGNSREQQAPSVEEISQLEDEFMMDRLLAEQQQTWGTEQRSWRRNETQLGQALGIRAGMVNSPLEVGLVPRTRTLERWNWDINTVEPPFHPKCFSTRATDERFLLTPLWMEGWEHWVHPNFQDKPYYMSRTPGAKIAFEISTSAGIIKMYALKSRFFGLGKVSCWVDDEKDKAVTINGYWEKEENIGRFSTIGDHLAPGRHTAYCEILEETSAPDGGTEFRIISIMRFLHHFQSTDVSS